MLKPGMQAPSFEAETQFGTTFRLSDYRGRKNVLVLGYPADFTPICTSELPALNRLASRFDRDADTVVVSLSCDSIHSHRRWSASDLGNIVFDMLSDMKPLYSKISHALGMWSEANKTTDRATLIIDKNGVVRFAESAGIDGKRDVSRLYDLAVQINGGAKPGTTPLPADEGPSCTATGCAVPEEGNTSAPAIPAPPANFVLEGNPAGKIRPAAHPAPAGQAFSGPRLRLFVLNGCPQCIKVKTWLAKQPNKERVEIFEVSPGSPGRAEYNNLRPRPQPGAPLLAVGDNPNSKLFYGDQQIGSELKKHLTA